MISNNKKKEYKTASKKQFPGGLVMPDIQPGGLQSLLDVQDTLRAVNDYASGLSFALPNEGVLRNYIDIIEIQRDTLSSVLEIGENLKIENEKIVSLLDTVVSPLNGAITEIGLIAANSGKLRSLDLISSKQLQFSNGLSGLALDILQEQQNVVSAEIASMESSGVFKTISEIAPALQTISSGVSEIVRSLPTYPIDTELVLPELETVRKETEIDEEDVSEHHKRLDALLEQVNPDLIKFRKGAWKVFNRKGDDYVGQASGSMRRLVDTLLREIAPSKKVAKTKFFKISSKAKNDKGRPTRRARVMFAISWDQNKSKRLKRLVNGFLASYDNLPAWNHAPLNKDSFVHGALITIEGYLISLLSENQE